MARLTGICGDVWVFSGFGVLEMWDSGKFLPLGSGFRTCGFSVWAFDF